MGLIVSSSIAVAESSDVSKLQHCGQDFGQFHCLFLTTTRISFLWVGMSSPRVGIHQVMSFLVFQPMQQSIHIVHCLFSFMGIHFGIFSHQRTFLEHQMITNEFGYQSIIVFGTIFLLVPYLKVIFMLFMGWSGLLWELWVASLEEALYGAINPQPAATVEAAWRETFMAILANSIVVVCDIISMMTFNGLSDNVWGESELFMWHLPVVVWQH